MRSYQRSDALVLTNKWTNYLSVIIFTMIFVIAIFFFSALISLMDTRYHLAPEMIKKYTENVKDSLFLHLMGFENPYFTQVLPDDSTLPSVSSLALKLVMSIEPGDIRSLLGNELPGFALYDSEIIVAGEGTNYTNLSVESAPPIEEIMAERKADVKELHELDSKDKGDIKQPTQTTGGENVVFLYSTHSTESYLPAIKGAKNPSQAYSTKISVRDVGERIGEDLKKEGIGAIVDQTNFINILNQKGMKYYQAYGVSRNSVVSAMEHHSSLKLFFDIHRDSRTRQYTTTTIDGKTYARVLFTVGEGHKNYEENAQMAEQLHHLLEEKYPKLSRGVEGKNKSEGNGVYNQDLSGHALIIEIGGVDNTLQEVYRSADKVAQAIGEYYWHQQNAKKVNG